AGSRQAHHLVGGIEGTDVGAGTCMMQQTHATAIAVAGGVGFLDRFDSLNRCQAWVSGSDTHEPDPAGGSHEEEVRAFGLPRSWSAPTVFLQPHYPQSSRALGGHRRRENARARVLDEALSTHAQGQPPPPHAPHSPSVLHSEELTGGLL